MLNKLKENYPKSWKCWSDWCQNQICLESGFLLDGQHLVHLDCGLKNAVEAPFSILYGLFLEFFDSEKIIIDVFYQTWNKSFDFKVRFKFNEHEISCGDYKNRINAQKTAISKAFKMLEERL